MTDPDRDALISDVVGRVIHRFRVWLTGALITAALPLAWLLADLRDATRSMDSIKANHAEMRAELGRTSAKIEVMTELYYRLGRAETAVLRPDPILDAPPLEESQP